jgi:hypothetical protein
MRSDTQTMTVHADPDTLFAFLAEPRNLPKWAVGFCRDIRRDGDAWVVATGQGEVTLRVEADPSARTVDFRMSPAPGVEVLAASRVVPNGAEAEYVFTQFQPDGMPDQAFAANVRALSEELLVLKHAAAAWAACPA